MNIQKAVTALKEGQTIAYPTEAVWGLGCDPMNQNAFNHILKLKQRPLEKGVILLAGNINQVEHLLKNLSLEIQAQIKESWLKPQQRATTWLLPIHPSIPTWITGKYDTVAVRVTQHILCKEICSLFGNFIVSTSANPSGLEPALNNTQAKKFFKNNVVYINGELGEYQEPSRIIDARTGIIIRS